MGKVVRPSGPPEGGRHTAEGPAKAAEGPFKGGHYNADRDQGPAARPAPAPARQPDSFKDAFLGRIKTDKKFFYGTVIAQANRIDVSGDTVTFSFSPTHRALRAQLEQNRPWLEGIAENVAGRRMTLASVETGGAAAETAAVERPDAADREQHDAALRAKAMENEGVQALLDVFSAEITKIEEL
jgi:hypothetical protein